MGYRRAEHGVAARERTAKTYAAALNLVVMFTFGSLCLKQVQKAYLSALNEEPKLDGSYMTNFGIRSSPVLLNLLLNLFQPADRDLFGIKSGALPLTDLP